MAREKYRKIFFHDDQQDCLWWVINGAGTVVVCDMQGWVWNGTEVFMTDKAPDLEDIQPGDHLICKFKSGHCGSWKHAVEKVREIRKLPQPILN
jgi:hypothetical protein